MPVARLLKRAEALQSPVYAGGAYETTHRRETSQMHCEYTGGTGCQLGGHLTPVGVRIRTVGALPYSQGCA